MLLLNKQIGNEQTLSIFKYKDEVTMTCFEDMNYQIFYSSIGNYVYDKQKEQVTELSIDGFTRLVLKLESVVNYPEYYTKNK